MEIEVIQNIESYLPLFLQNSRGEIESVLSSETPIRFSFPIIVNDEAYNVAAEDAICGGIDGVNTLWNGRALDSEEYSKIKETTEKAGRKGEEFINNHFNQLRDEGKIINFRWISNEFPLSPYDFEIIDTEGVIFIEVKTTTGEMDRRIHISYNELLQMSKPIRYQIYRVYRINEDPGFMIIYKGLRKFAQKMIEIFNIFPSGIKPDSISLPPSKI